LILLIAQLAAANPPPPPPSARTTHHDVRAARGELEAGSNLAGGASTWAGDAVAYAGITAGMRFFRIVSGYAGIALGYGGVDERLLTRLSFGLSVGYTFADRFRPRAYVGIVHQHEESLAAVAQQAAGAIFGIGTGIRHRAGVHFGVGFDITLYHRGNVEFAVGPDVSAMYLTYSSGPSWYVIGGATATFHYALF
jgi:hypothetical protein